jgi:pimeloyl-ACP methyl ester carboxylesterase
VTLVLLLTTLPVLAHAQAPPPPPPPPRAAVPPLEVPGNAHVVDVGGRRLHVVVHGAGAPTVVLVSGFGAPQATWNAVVPALAAVTTVVTYDRAGVGDSELGSRPADGRQSAVDLKALLTALGVPRPCVLVGHSYGGRVVRLFAAAYPEDTAGIVLAETGHEDTPDAQRAVLEGADRETFDRMIAPFLTPPADPRTEQDFMAVTQEQLRASGPLPHVPLVVVTAGSRGLGLPPAFSAEGQRRLEEVAMRMQDRLVALVPGAEHIVVEGAGHNVHLDRPEAVIAPIVAMVTRLRLAPVR